MTPICYACFDGDNDIHYYRLMQAWHKNEKFDFTFQNAHEITQARDSSSEQTIKRSLRTRLNASDVFIVLVGKNTQNLYKYVRWEIEVAIDMELPIIVVNLDNKTSINLDLCPPILRNHLAVHVSYGPKIINYAIKQWPSEQNHLKSNKITGPRKYSSSIYSSLT